MLHLLFISVFFSLSDLELMHPIHLTVTNVDCRPDETEIIFRFFIDDFENSLNKTLQANCHILSNKESDNPLIIKYIKKNFSLYYDGENIFKKAKLTRKENEREANSIKLYYTCPATPPQKIKIHNTFLNNLFKDQKNLLIFSCRNKQEGFTFTHNKTVAEYIPE